jgi:hypothetical protein
VTEPLERQHRQHPHECLVREAHRDRGADERKQQRVAHEEPQPGEDAARSRFLFHAVADSNERDEQQPGHEE